MMDAESVEFVPLTSNSAFVKLVSVALSTSSVMDGESRPSSTIASANNVSLVAFVVRLW